MKPKPDFETPFEDSLAEFEMAPLPGNWKAELIDNALSEATGLRISRFPAFTKISVSLLVACWVVIGFLHATTPVESDFAAPQFAEKTILTPENRVLLATYFGGGSRLNSTQLP